MPFNIDQFRQEMLFDGARPNLFEVSLVLPGFVEPNVSKKITFMAKSASLPAAIVGTARVSYFGRDIKFPGDRVFPDWNIQVINDESFGIRDAFEYWINSINGNASALRTAPINAAGGYAVDATVTQYGKTGNKIKTYAFRGLFPTQVDPINLSWDARDQIEEFGVNFSYQYWEDTSFQNNPSQQIFQPSQGFQIFTNPTIV